MKKFLLPLAAVLVGATAFAEEVTVKYYGNTFRDNVLSDVELFKPTTHEVVANADGSYTLKKYLYATNNIGQYKDLTFSFTSDGAISYAGFSTNSSSLLSLSAMFGQDYYVNLVSAIDNSDLHFAAKLYYPNPGLAAYYSPAKVETLGEGSAYTYHVIISSGINGTTSISQVPGASDFVYGANAGFCLVFDMVPKSESGIADVIADEDAPAEWFNLQGVRVSGDNLAPGIYIKRQGSKAVKVLVK